MVSHAALKRGIVGGLAGVLAAELASPIAYKVAGRLPRRLSMAVRRYAPSHSREIATTTLATGIFSGSPFTMGVGVGMVADDVFHSLRQSGRSVKEWNKAIDGLPPIDMHKYDIPDWLPDALAYRMLGAKLREIVTENTYNRAQRAWIPAGREHPAVVVTARRIIAENGLDGHDKAAVLATFQQWVKDHIRYSYDALFNDQFFHPYLTLMLNAGDCDCQSLLMASLGESVGIKMKLKLISQMPDTPTKFNHIYSVGEVGGKDIPLETIFPWAPFGWEPPHVNSMLVQWR